MEDVPLFIVEGDQQLCRDSGGARFSERGVSPNSRRGALSGSLDFQNIPYIPFRSVVVRNVLHEDVSVTQPLTATRRERLAHQPTIKVVDV